MTANSHLIANLRQGTTVHFEIPAKRVMQALPPLEYEHQKEISTAEVLDPKSKEFEDLTTQIQNIIKTRQVKKEYYAAKQHQDPEPSFIKLKQASSE